MLKQVDAIGICQEMENKKKNFFLKTIFKNKVKSQYVDEIIKLSSSYTMIAVKGLTNLHLLSLSGVLSL